MISENRRVTNALIRPFIVRGGAVTWFLVSEETNYQTAMQLAGFVGKKTYLVSNYLGINCTVIGAFYDEETQDVLYGMAIGK